MGGSEWGLGGTLPDVLGRRHTAKAQLLVKQQIRKEICFSREILDSPICLSRYDYRDGNQCCAVFLAPTTVI